MRTKICTRCGERKLLDEFGKEKKGKYGRQSKCRNCKRIIQLEFRQTAAGKAIRSRYQYSEKGKAAQRRYYVSPKGLENAKRAREKFPERFKARMVLNKAIERGKLSHIFTQRCTDCGKQAEQYHHINGYTKKYWLDVVPLCRTCHRKRHS